MSRDPAPATTAEGCQLSRTYVSNEEVAIAAEMRAIKDRVQALRQRARDGEQAAEAQEPELASLRAEWQDLASRLDRATRRKHMMLGHAPLDPAAFEDPA